MSEVLQDPVFPPKQPRDSELGTGRPLRGWALLAVSALVASLLAVGSAPAGAAEIKTGEDNKAEQSAKPKFSACVGAAHEDAGFTDLGTLSTAAAAINCLAYYGISSGKTADTFDPNSNVTRSQMALFLYAAASKAGTDLMGGDMMADFGDIAELGENRQNAIKALARNGIMSGSGGIFRPHDDITRAEMAVALVNLVRHTAPRKFVQAGDDKGKLAGSDGAALAADKVDYFADARRMVPAATDTHISYAYELGITSGTGDGTTFSPNAPVPRRQMAVFITAALAHSNLRPAGLTVQSDNGELTASLRNADFEPVANELIDAFYVDTAGVDRAFNNDGECRSIVKAVDGNDNPCEIHVLDAATDADGNTPLNGLTADQIGRGVTVWVWTGDAGDKFDEDTSRVMLEQGPVSDPTPADVKVEPIGAYAVVGTAANPASHGVTVTVTDQYGRPMRNQAVTLSSDSTSSTFPGARRTGSNGTVRIFYSHAGTAAATEALTATWDAGPGPDGVAGNSDDPADVTGTASVYWAVRAADGAPSAATAVIAADLEENEIVVDASTPTVVRYDANDIFSTSVPVAGTPTVTYRDMDDFEELLATVVDPANVALTGAGKRTATLTWSAYDADDEDARTFFTFVMSIAS